MSPGAPRQRRK